VLLVGFHYKNTKLLLFNTNGRHMTTLHWCNQYVWQCVEILRNLTMPHIMKAYMG